MRSGLTYWEQSRAPVVADIIGRFVPCTARVAVDIGCGSGALTKELSTKFNRIIGIDIDYNAIRPQRDNSVQLLVGDAIRLPLQSNSVDFVFSYGALHHTQLAKALTEIVRVTAPQGKVVLIDFCTIEATASPGRLDYTLTVLRAFNDYRHRLGVVPALRIIMFRLSSTWWRHQREDSFLTLDAFSREYGAKLTGADIHQDGDRMTVIWSRARDK
jgi:SAM-dependent methyltransferase